MSILNHIRYGVELERAQMPDNGLNESPGLWNSLLGSISGATQEGVDNKRSAVNNSAANRYIESQGYTREQLGLSPTARLTEGGAASAIRKHLDKKTEAKEETAFQRSLVPLTKQLEATSEQNRLQHEATLTQGRNALAAQQAQLRAQLEQSNNQFAFTSRENSLNRRHERELAGSREDLQMQMAIMNAELADKRMAYDRETQRMDRRDRMIAQLMSGLGQLGGAFSL